MGYVGDLNHSSSISSATRCTRSNPYQALSLATALTW